MHSAAYLVGDWAMTRLLLPLCLIIASPSFAATWRDGGGWNAAPVSQGSDGVWSVLPDMSSPNNGHVTTCTTSSCTRTGSLPAPVGGGNGRILPSAGFGKGAVVAGALALGSRAFPWLSVGMGLYDWFNQAGLTADPQTGALGEISGAQAVAPSVVYRPDSSPFVNGAGFFASRSEALLAGSSRYAQELPSILGSGYSCVVVTPSSWSGSSIVNGTARCQRGAGAPDNYVVNIGLASRTDSTAQCYYVSDGRLSGSAATGGACPSGSFTPLTQTAAADRLNNAPITADVLKRSLEEVLKAGGSLEDTGTHTVTGPASIPGETKIKTVTAANGTTQVTTVTNNYNYNYAGNTITITTTELVQNPDGSTEETTSDTPDPLCAQNPNSLACIKLGDVPTDQPAWETRTIAYQADSLGLPAACPAPWTGQLRGWTLSFSYQPACDVAPQVRLAILALTALGSLLMIVTTVRT